MNQLSIFIAKNLFILIACLYIILNVQINYPLKLFITLISACTIVISFQKYIKETYKTVKYYNDVDESDFDKLLLDGTLDNSILQSNLDKYKNNIKAIEDKYNSELNLKKDEDDDIEDEEYEEDEEDEEDVDNLDDDDYDYDYDDDDDLDDEDDLDDYEDNEEKQIENDNNTVKQLLDDIENKIMRDEKIARELVNYKEIYNSNNLTRKHNKLYAAKKHLNHHD